MEEVLLATCLTGAALFAMKVLLLHVVVKNAALPTKVLPKLNLAVAAEFSRRLHLQTVVAFDLLHVCCVKLMRDSLDLRLNC